MFDTQESTNSSREFLNLRAASNAELSYMNIPSTLEIKPVTIETKYDTSTSIASTLSHNTQCLKFVNKLFSHHPEWFGTEGESLLYLQHAGKRFKPEAYYTTFSTFLLNHNASRLNDLRSNKLKDEICYDIDLLLSWARVIQSNKLITEFEPIMKQLKIALNDWFANKVIDFGGKKVPYANFKPLLYTHSGENIYNLLPFITYIYCFFINCYPFTFDEGQTDSSAFGFFSRIEAHFSKYLMRLANDMGLSLAELTSLSMDNLLTKDLTVADWSGMLREMLAPDVIITFRNEEMNQTPELLEQAISQQNKLDTDGVKKAFADTFFNLIYIVVNNNPVKRILDMFMTYDADKYNARTVSLMTEWALAGADKLFNIEISSREKTNAVYTFNNTPASEQPKYPQTILKQAKVSTDIAKINQSHMKPFSNSDFVLRLVSSYVKKQFDVKRLDAFDDEIELNEGAYEYEGFAEDIKNVFVNAVWALEGHVMAQMLDKLILNGEFVKQMADIVVLDKVCSEMYENKFGAKLIVPFILCYMKEALRTVLVKGLSMRAITPYTWLVDINKDGIFEQNLMRELVNVAMGIIFIKSPKYTRFVNNTVDGFMDVMITGPLMYDVFVKCLDDDAELYAAGGCGLYETGINKNPLIRGLLFAKSMIGWSANLETVYKYVETMTNSASFEVIEENKKSLNVVEALLKTHWIGLFGKGTIPYTLNNYIVNSKGAEGDIMGGTKETSEWLTMSMRSTPSFIDLKTKIGSGEVGIIDLALKLAFRWSNPKAVEDKVICFRPIVYKQNVVKASKVLYNKMAHGGREYSVQFSGTGSLEKVPVYDYTANVEDVGMIFVNPAGMRRIVVEMFSSVNDCEQCVWVYTTVGKESRFRRKEDNVVSAEGNEEDVVKSLSLAQPRVSKKGIRL